MNENLKNLIRNYFKLHRCSALKVDDLIDEYESMQTFTKYSDGSMEMITGNSPDEVIAWLNDKVRQQKYTKEFFLQKIQSQKFILQRLCEHIVLRPNDNKRRFGEIGFNNMVQAVEDSLTADMELYEYYYDMKKHEHDFHDYATWKVWGRKVGIK